MWLTLPLVVQDGIMLGFILEGNTPVFVLGQVESVRFGVLLNVAAPKPRCNAANLVESAVKVRVPIQGTREQRRP